MFEKELAEYQKSLPEWVTIGVVSGAHGIQGEIKVVPMTDDPQRFRLLDQIYLDFSANNLKSYTIQRVRFQKRTILLKLEGIEDRSTVEQLQGIELKIPRESCLELPDDQYYIFQIIGLAVYSTDGQWLGKLSDVMQMPANDVYVVQNGEQEILIPAIKDVIKKVDLETGVMTIELLEGLLP